MDRDEVERIYMTYFDTVYRICFLYMKNETDAGDMVQETFLRLIRSGPEFETEQKVKAWLIVTASNCCKTQLTRWWRTKRVEYNEEQIKTIADRQDRELLESVLGLDKKYSVPMYLYYFEGYKTGEIARMLNINSSTIQTRLAKAREILKLEIEKDFDGKKGGRGYEC
ncbi:MAG: RNA polymerase sigma factor [Lachnospiraceae bacterium]|nr:RNA polymerase sigma factor [Lachnospiraceae bacterium]